MFQNYKKLNSQDIDKSFNNIYVNYPIEHELRYTIEKLESRFASFLHENDT